MATAADERLQALVPAGTWQVDPAHSSIELQVKHMMIATVKGRFNRFAGTLVAGEDGTLTASGTVQAASVDTHDATRDEHLRSADFFDAATYPELGFVSREIAPTGGSGVRVAGELTIKGVTKPVELAGSVLGTGLDPWGNERVALELRAEIDRKDFGLSWNQALETGGVLVSDRVKLELELSALKPAADAPAA